MTPPQFLVVLMLIVIQYIRTVCYNMMMYNGKIINVHIVELPVIKIKHLHNRDVKSIIFGYNTFKLMM